MFQNLEILSSANGSKENYTRATGNNFGNSGRWGRRPDMEENHYYGESANTSNEDSKPNQTDRQKENKIKMNVQLSKLMSSCAILRIDDFTVYKVTTSCNKQGLKEFIYGDRSHITLPKDSNNFHAEFIYYYYPSNILFPRVKAFTLVLTSLVFPLRFDHNIETSVKGS
ncbi:hypothetical protein JTB14_036156 [Gonioctena quinquepunctata]|nr:hypothetical protein JTB14_036156 [Gonioctena quinquepunctata]